MPGYIPGIGKRLEALAECERQFLEALASDPVPDKLAEVADQVRDAQIRALRAKAAQLVPSERNASGREHIMQEVRFWKRLTVDEIIQGYREGKLRGHRSQAVRRLAHSHQSLRPR